MGNLATRIIGFGFSGKRLNLEVEIYELLTY